MSNSRRSGSLQDTHRYTLWREVVERADGTFITNAILISMGEHGAMQTSPVEQRREPAEVSGSGDGLNDLAAHNIA